MAPSFLELEPPRFQPGRQSPITPVTPTLPVTPMTSTKPSSSLLPEELTPERASQADDSPSTPTKTEGAFKVQQQLGEGRFSHVFKAYEVNTGRNLAIKMRKSEVNVEAFRQEVAILNHLQQSHADRYNIVKCLGSYWKPGEARILFEILDMTLSQYMQSVENRLCIQNISTIIGQVASALDTLGKLNVVHADVTPANIMLVDKLRKPFKVKLIDFGSAVWIDQLKRRDPPVQSLPFRSPEILLGHTFNEAIDMWSLGCVMARMFIGCDLFPGTSDYEVIRSIVDLLGKPSPMNLWTGSKTFKYFELEWKSLIPYWTLRKPNDPRQDITKFIESRQYSFTSLDVLKVEATDGEISLADDDKNACVELIKRMLDLRMETRIKPFEVLTDPFITRSFTTTHPPTIRNHGAS